MENLWRSEPFSNWNNSLRTKDMDETMRKPRNKPTETSWQFYEHALKNNFQIKNLLGCSTYTFREQIPEKLLEKT